MLSLEEGRALEAKRKVGQGSGAKSVPFCLERMEGGRLLCFPSTGFSGPLASLGGSAGPSLTGTSVIPVQVCDLGTWLIWPHLVLLCGLDENPFSAERN